MRHRFIVLVIVVVVAELARTVGVRALEVFADLLLGVTDVSMSGKAVGQQHSEQSKSRVPLSCGFECRPRRWRT